MPPIPQKIKAKLKPQVEDAESWTEKEITLIPYDKSEKQTVKVLAYGGLAVHKYVFEDAKEKMGKYVITHIASHREACVVKTEEDAMLIAEHLWDHYRSVFRWRAKEEVKKESPKEMIDWINECGKAGKYVARKK